MIHPFRHQPKNLPNVKIQIKMRQYKFRGKDSNGIWRYGHLLTRDIDTGRVYIREMSIENVPPRYTDYEVDPESVGEICPYTDSEGHEVYDGDYLSNNFGTNKEVVREATFRLGAWYLSHRIGKTRMDRHLLVHDVIGLNFVVVGNKFDTPELVQNKVV